MSTPAPRPSIALTVSLLLAMTALYFTGEVFAVWVFAFAILWTHFSSRRYPRQSSGAWLMRLVLLGGIFAGFGGKPGIGADWIFDAKTFNTIGLIAAAEAALQAWREPPEGLRYQPLLVLMSGIVFLAACNTYDERFIRFFAPLYLLSTLLALRDVHVRESDLRENNLRTASPLQLRGVLALATVFISGAALHFSITQNRQNAQIWMMHLMRNRLLERGGISNQPMLSSTFNLQGSTRRVLRIEGALSDDHLRAAVFEDYANGRWGPPLDAREKTSFPESPLPHTSAPRAGSTLLATVTKLDDLDKLIFAPLNSLAIIPATGSSFEWTKNLGPLRCEDAAPYSYQIFSSEQGNDLGVSTHQGVLCAAPLPSEKQRLLNVPPEVDARVKQLALKITQNDFDAPDKIEAIANYLLTHHKYSRTTTRGKGDPVSNFLLERKNAHCEYFASAAVILIRCAGIPARYATGYMAHERDGNVTVVRSRDAHAWAEAFVQGVGWITVDATPADGTPEANPKVSWLQRTLEKLQDEIGKLREKFGGISRPQLFGFIIFIVVAALLEKWRQSRRKAAREAAQEYSSPEALKPFAARFQKLLAREKIDASQSQSWSEVLQAHDAPPEYSGFAARYNRARFGGEFDAKFLDELQQLLTNLEKGNGHDDNAEQQPGNGRTGSAKRPSAE